MDCTKTTMTSSIDTNSVVGASPRLFDILRTRSTTTSTSTVYGSDEELGLIQDALERVSETESISSEIVLVHGRSGCGKSSIIKALQQWTKEERDDLNVYFGSGKYDQLVNNEPFAAIVAASNELCRSIDGSIAVRFAKVFRAMTGGDTAMLCNAIPNLSRLLAKADKQTAMEGLQNGNNATLGAATEEQPKTTEFEATSLAFTRFKQLWQLLLLAIASCSEATVLFLDDVQWADPSSIDLIHSLTKITRARNILIVCAFRDDATVEKAQLDRIRWCFSLEDSLSNSFSVSTSTQRRLSTCDSTKLTLPLTDVSLTNLDASGMKELVTGLLYGHTGNEETSEGNNSNDNTIMDMQRISDLSNIVLTHTDGNPFFVLHYLDYLTRVRLLRTTDDNGISWEWDLQAIDNQDSVPHSTTQLLRQVISDLPREIREVLVAASHVGFRFPSALFQQQTLVDYILGNNAGRNTSSRREESIPTSVGKKDRAHKMDIESILESAVEEGLLESVGNKEYVFPHDQIQQAFYSTMTDRPQEQEQLHFKIGMALLEMIEQEQNKGKSSDDNTMQTGRTSVSSDTDTVLFVAVDNINKGERQVLNPEMRIGLAQLNYDAARAAMSKAAMEGALAYVRAALSLLGPNRWSTQYTLSLNVCTLAVELEHATGNHLRCRSMLDEIQAEGQTVFDKLPSYFTEIEALASDRKVDEAIKLGIKVLGLLGERVPAKPGILRVVLELRTTTKLMNKAKEAGFMSLPKMADPSKMAVLKIVGKIIVLSVMSGSKYKNFSGVLFLRLGAMCCLHGLSPHLPLSVQSYAAVQCSLGQFEECREFTMLASDLLNSIEGIGCNEAEAMAGKHALLSPWWEGVSLADAQPEFPRCYHKAMSYGNVSLAFICGCHHMVCALIRGTPIPELDKDFERYIDGMDQFQMNHTKIVALGYWRMARSLSGRDDRTCAGDSLAVTHLYRELESLPQTEFMICSGIAFQILPRILLGTFGADETLEEDKKMLTVLMNDPEAVGIYFSRTFLDLALALGCMVLHKKTGKWKYKRSGWKVFQWLEKLHGKKASIAMGPYRLIRAEQMAVEGDKHSWESIQAEYIDAVEQSRRHGGFAAVEGYAFERLAVLAAGHDDHDTSQMYYRQALTTYENWGASEKVKQLLIVLDERR